MQCADGSWPLFHRGGLKLLFADATLQPHSMHARRFGFVLSLIGAFAAASGCAEAEDPNSSAVMYVAAGTRETTVYAGFLGDGFGASGCSTTLIDRCYVTTCLDGGGVQTYVDGGKVEFSGGELDATVDTGAVEDSAGDLGPGLAVAEGLPVVHDDETITISLHGKGSVPKLEGSVELPPRLLLAAPELEEAACEGVDPEDVAPIPVDATDDFRVSWSSDREDDVDILFMFDDIKDYPDDSERERRTTIRCLYTADEEEAVIPEEVVELMPPGRGSFTIRQIVSHAEVTDEWTLTFGAYWELCSPVEVE